MTEQDLDLFQRFNNNECSEQETKMIRDRLKSDPDFKSNYDAFITSIYLIKRDAFKKHLGNKRSKSWAMPKIVIAASVLVLVLALVYYVIQGNLKKKEVDTDALFAEYFEPLPDFITNRSTSNGLAIAMEAYGEEDYERALKFLDTSIYNQDLVRIYRAVSKIKLRNYNQESINIELNKLPADHPFEEHVNWYLALVSLSVGDIGEAVSRLENINPGEYNYEESRQLIRELR